MLSISRELIFLSIAFISIAGPIVAYYIYLKAKNEAKNVSAKQRDKDEQDKYEPEFIEQSETVAESYSIVAKDEQIRYQIYDDYMKISVTANRLIVLQLQNAVQHHFDIDEIAHILYSRGEVREYRSLGSVSFLIGLLTIVIASQYLGNTIVIGLGLLLILMGTVLIFYTKKESALYITLRGIPNEYKFNVDAELHDVQELIKLVFNSDINVQNNQLDLIENILNPEIR